MRKVLVSFLLMGSLLLSIQLWGEQEDTAVIQQEENLEDADKTLRGSEWLHSYLRCLFLDTGHIWKDIFTISSLKVATAALPLYIAVRPANKAIHRKFYDPITHTNIKQPGKFWREIAVSDGIVAIPFVAFNIYGFASRKPLEFRRVQVFNAGLLSTWGTKMLIKGLRHRDCYRPWHQDFSCSEQATNGFPSGHSAMVAYLATFWALEKGYKWGLPLGTYTLYTMAINVVANNHYISQVFAGAALGVLFGVAAHNAFQKTIVGENLTVGFGTDSRHKPAFSLAYEF